VTRSRRAGLSRDEVRRQPLYARMLGLQYLAPSGFLCFVFLEGAVALGILLALAELVSWWGVLVLPVTVAAMVKLNDVVAGALTRAAAAGRAAAGRPAYGGVPGSIGDGPASTPSERALRGARTVRLAPAVIARAARGARRDERSAYGKRSAENRAGRDAAGPGGWEAAGLGGREAEPLGGREAAGPGGGEAETPGGRGAESRTGEQAENQLGGPADTWSAGSSTDSAWTPSGTSEWAPPAGSTAWEAADSTRWTARADDHLPPPGPSTLPDDPEALNIPRPTRPWAGHLDDHQQRARQSAARRYQ